MKERVIRFRVGEDLYLKMVSSYGAGKLSNRIRELVEEDIEGVREVPLIPCKAEGESSVKVKPKVDSGPLCGFPEFHRKKMCNCFRAGVKSPDYRDK